MKTMTDKEKLQGLVLMHERERNYSPHIQFLLTAYQHREFSTKLEELCQIVAEAEKEQWEHEQRL